MPLIPLKPLNIKNNNSKTAILGAGLSGLTVGYLLDQKNQSFEVLEMEPECGGLMRSTLESGFTFDSFGSHIIFSKNEYALNFLLSILENNYIKNRRKTKILYNGLFIKYPFENGLADLPKAENFECLTSFIEMLLSKANCQVTTPYNLHDWFITAFGRGIAEKYLIPYNEKIWKFPIESLGLNWVKRIPDPPYQDIIKSSLGLATEGYTHQLYFYYPLVGGINAIINSLKSKIDANITCSFKIKKITKADDKWAISDGIRTKFFDRIISCIPIHNLVNAIDAPDDIKHAVDCLKYNSLISVMLAINKEKINDLSWLYIPDRDVLTHRVSFPSNYSPDTAPLHKSSILAEVTCRPGDHIWLMSDKELIDRTISDLCRLRFISNEDVCFASVRRTEFAYVINDLYYEDNLNRVTKYFSDLGIALVGRFAEFKYLNMDDCVQSALDFVDKLIL
jgi:protoporphyrinogen oxidase